MKKGVLKLGVSLLAVLAVTAFVGVSLGQESAPAPAAAAPAAAAPAAAAPAAPAAPAAAPVVPGAPVSEIKEYHLYKDWCGILLIIWSVTMVALVVERGIAWLNFRSKSIAIAASVRSLLINPDRAKLREVFSKSDAPLARVMNHVFKHETQESPETTLLLLDDAVDDVQGSMKKHLTLLAAIANTGPFLGLLGTVLGIINTFDTIARKGVSNPALISYGIGQALWTTAAGLTIAIPAFIAYNIYAGKANKEGASLRMQANRIFVSLGDL